MELQRQIKKYRNELKLSQEELAEKIFVSRQTISNWETGKSYPDVHSLLLLSSCFNVSLDRLVKGDIEKMKEEIKKSDINALNRDSLIFSILLITFILSVMPLVMFLDVVGIVISGGIFAVALFFGLRIERFKKKNDIYTYKEIIAFTEGKQLDESKKQQEIGKRRYQQVLLAIASGLITAVIAGIMFFIFERFV